MQKVLSRVTAQVSKSSQSRHILRQAVFPQISASSYRSSSKLPGVASLNLPLQEAFQEHWNPEFEMPQPSKIATSQIHASPKVDPGCREIFGCLRKDFD